MDAHTSWQETLTGEMASYYAIAAAGVSPGRGARAVLAKRPAQWYNRMGRSPGAGGT